jgi:hypothetical protein
MTVIYNQATINARLTDVLNQISSGVLTLLDAANNSLVSIPVSGLSVAGGVLSFGVASATIALSGAAVAAQISQGSTNVVTGLTVSSAAGSDIFMSNPVMIAGNQVTLTSGSITGR